MIAKYLMEEKGKTEVGRRRATSRERPSPSLSLPLFHQSTHPKQTTSQM